MRFVSTLLASALLLACTTDEERLPIAAGDTWQLSVTIDSADPCPTVQLPANLIVTVVEVDGQLRLRGADGEVIDEVDIDERGTHARFRVQDTWTTVDGAAVAPTAIYELDVFDNGTISGAASSEFVFDTESAGTTCRQTLSITGQVFPDDGSNDCKIGALCG